MKESNFYSDDFEQLIREKTEQYKVYPYERVWKGVHNSLHTKRRWFIGSMSLLVTGILFLAGRELIAQSGHTTVLRKPAPAAASVTEAAKPYLVAHTPHSTLASLHSSNTSSSASHRTNAAENDPVQEQDPGYKDISITLSHPVIDASDLSGWLSQVQLPDHAPEITVIAARTTGADAARMPEDGLKTAAKPGAETASEGLTARGVLESLSANGAGPNRNARMNGRLAKNRSDGSAVTGDGLLPDSVSTSGRASAAAIAEVHDRQRVNWLHDYALNTLPPPDKRGRTFFQLTLAPTINYKSFNGTDPAFEKFSPGFSAISHSSSFGFEFGGSMLYRLTRNLSVKGGLQFNFVRFQITAYAAQDPSGQGIILETYFGHIADSMKRQANAGQQSNAPPSSPVTILTLNNDYYQLSAPIGFELRVLGNERLQFNLGATVQPSYLLGSTSYMLDQDYMKYSKQPNKYRKWNVSGGGEAFPSLPV